MQHRACPDTPRARNGNVQPAFGGRFSAAARRVHASRLVNFDNLAGFEEALIDPAAGDGEPQRLATHDGAEITAGPERPAAGVAVPAQLGQLSGERLEGLGRHASTITSASDE